MVRTVQEYRYLRRIITTMLFSKKRTQRPAVLQQIHIKTADMSISANYTEARDALGADLEELTWRPAFLRVA